MKKQYCISDIHGCLRSFRHLVENIICLTKDDNLYLLGDYISRGPDSKGVIDYIIELKTQGYQVRTLEGNHEAMVKRSLYDRDHFNHYINKNGGYATLRSFDLLHIDSIEKFSKESFEKKYIDFLESLELFIELENWWLVHAGFNHNYGKPFDDINSMLWMRDYDLKPEYLHQLKNKRVVHGHTPHSLADIEKTLSRNNIVIDGGCVFSNDEYAEELGNLVALELKTMNLYYTGNIDF